MENVGMCYSLEEINKMIDENNFQQSRARRDRPYIPIPYPESVEDSESGNRMLLMRAYWAVNRPTIAERKSAQNSIKSTLKGDQLQWVLDWIKYLESVNFQRVSNY